MVCKWIPNGLAVFIYILLYFRRVLQIRSPTHTGWPGYHGFGDYRTSARSRCLYNSRGWGRADCGHGAGDKESTAARENHCVYTLHRNVHKLRGGKFRGRSYVRINAAVVFNQEVCSRYCTFGRVSNFLSGGRGFKPGFRVFCVFFCPSCQV